MKDVLQQAIPISFIIALFPILVCAQRPVDAGQKGTLHKRTVSLQTILSCTDDPLIEEIFKTDSETARLKLNALLMIEAKFKKVDVPEYNLLRLKGFVTNQIDDSHVSILPTNILTGSPIAEASLPFCHDLPTASYEKPSDSSPNLVSISGEDWLFNPNELFFRADQFRFDSGVFANSANVYLSATKGRTTIQFIAKPMGLTFYRVLYSPRG
jgi:hypothetical protein